MTAKDLKNALLQEAVQGKLVPQIASEGNARDLLEEIRKEKLSHGFANSYGICDGKNKKSKSSDLRSKSQISVTKKELPEITEEEIPFEIPESWCWCRLGELGDFVRGSGIKRDETTNTGLPCVRYGEMYTTYKTKFSKTKSFTSKDVFEKCHKIHTNDILMALTGENKWDIALAATYEGTEELAMGGDLCKFTPINCNSLFLVYLINSPYGIEYKRNTSTGDIIVHTSTTKLGNLLIPLPPLAEQKRIVDAIEKFMPLIEEYGKKETELKTFNEQIGTLTKKAILQEAVQGKLVPQISVEGNAKDLLEEIKKEKAKLIKEGKIKKEKPLPEISEEDIPFDIPENWCWCRLGEIVNKLTDGTHRTPKYVEKGIPFLSVKNLSSGKMDFDNTKFITPEEHKELYARCNPEKGDMLLTKVGTTGIPVINDSDIEFSLFVSVALIKFNHNLLDEKFFLYLLQSPLVQDQAKENTRGVGNKNWVMDAIANTVLVLPPVFEQKRIVEAIEKMLPLCEKLGE